jgi:hypothetical protein
MSRRAFILALGLVLASPLHAHRLSVDWRVEGNVLILQGRTDGTPTAGADVELRDAAGTMIASGLMDAAGRFRWPLSPVAGDLTVIINAGAGHRRTLTLAAADLRPTVNPAAATAPANASLPDEPRTAVMRPQGGSDSAEPLATRVVLGLTFLLAAAAAWMGHRNGRRLAALERRWHEHESRS